MRLIAQLWGTEGPSQILGLDQFCPRVDLADGAHGKDDASALIQQHLNIDAVIPGVGIPVPVQSAETRRRQRLIDRRVQVDPRVTLRHPGGEESQLFGQRWIHETCVAWTAPVMEQTNDWTNAQFPQSFEARIRP